MFKPIKRKYKALGINIYGGVMKRSLDKNESAKPEFNVVDWRPLGKHLAINAKP